MVTTTGPVDAEEVDVVVVATVVLVGVDEVEEVVELLVELGVEEEELVVDEEEELDELDDDEVVLVVVCEVDVGVELVAEGDEDVAAIVVVMRDVPKVMTETDMCGRNTR